MGKFEATPQTPPLNSNNLTLLQNTFPVQIYETKTAFFCIQLCVFLVFTEGLQKCQQGYYSQGSTGSGAESAVVSRQRRENFILFVRVTSNCHLFLSRPYFFRKYYQPWQFAFIFMSFLFQNEKDLKQAEIRVTKGYRNRKRHKQSQQSLTYLKTA